MLNLELKNKYRIDGDFAYIEINSPKYGIKETKINARHLKRIKDLDRTITLRYDPRMRSFYTSFKLNNKTVPFHRWLTNAAKGTHVDHQNSDTLDNTDENLHVCEPIENKRKKRSNITNSSGVRGVHWCKARGKWRGQVRSLGETHSTGDFDSLKEAKEATERKRKELWGYV